MQVFLEAATPEFLSLLFDALETKSYLKETATTTTVDHKVWNESHFLCLKAFSNLHKCHYVNAMDYPERLCTINLFCCHTVPQETILNFGKLTFQSLDLPLVQLTLAVPKKISRIWSFLHSALMHCIQCSICLLGKVGCNMRFYPILTKHNLPCYGLPLNITSGINLL